MIKFIQLIIVIGVISVTSSCATSMSPTQVSKTLPTLTMSKYMSQAQAKSAITSNSCEYLIHGRSYTAPMGLSVKADLSYGAKGIDEWVTLDGGNAYVLINYNWITVDDLGSTQLVLQFDTMICE